MQLDNTTAMFLDCLEAGLEPEIDGPWGDKNTNSLYVKISQFWMLFLMKDNAFIEVLLYSDKAYQASVMSCDWYNFSCLSPWRELSEEIKNLISDFVVREHDAEVR